jgi:hypothetical protein
VVVCFDCDEGGRASALRVARALVEAGVDARVLDLDPGRADGFDLSDFVASARSEAEREQARQLLADCAERALAPVVLAARGLGALLDDVVVFCRRFLATLADAHFDLLALWAAHTYVMDAAETTPYLHGTSAEILSGKTRMLEVLDLLVQKPAPILDPSAAALYRGLASKEVVTLLIDEVDNFLPGGKADSDAKKTILGILNGGYRRGMRVPRVTDGRNLEWFEPFGPKALTGLRGLPQTLASRSLRFEMRRRRRDEPVERFRRRRALADAEPLAGRLAAWASTETIAALAQADPALPAELDDRQMDACEILVAIADLAAGTWPKRARDALVTITREAGEVDAAESYGTQLLADMRDAFDEFDDRVATLDLLARLNALDERAWGSWHDGAGIDARALARVLRRFGIRPVTVRLADDTTAKGYRRDACEDAFARYLPPQSVTSVTTAQPCGSEAARDPSQDGACDGYAMAATPHGSGDVTDVTDLGHGKPPEEAAQRHEPPGPARTDDDRNEPGPEQMQFGADEAPAA